MKTILTFFISLTVATAALAQGAPATTPDVERRLRELEAKVEVLSKSVAASDLAEIRREISILTTEIEALRNQHQQKEPESSSPQYGLGTAASKVYRTDQGVSIGGYGEMLYQNFSGRTDAGQPAGATNRFDYLRGVLYAGYKFNKNVLFNSELEVEHASTETGGAVSLEFGYLDYLIRPELNVRAGLMLLPMGLINEQHEPTAFFGARRPLVETAIIPATWSEMGAGVFGDVGQVSYRAYLVTGLDSAKFDGSGIREGRQAGGESKARSFAVTGRADWKPFEGTFVGGSLYSGNSGQGARDPRGDRIDGRLTIAELHAESKFRGAAFRGLWSRGTVGDAAGINDANGVVGDDSVGRSFGGWYAEAGYDVASLWAHRDYSVSPFIRYERFDTQRSVPAGFERNPVNDGKIFTFGLACKPIPQTVIKIDYQNAGNRAGSGINQFNLALGYIF